MVSSNLWASSPPFCQSLLLWVFRRGGLFPQQVWLCPSITKILIFFLMMLASVWQWLNGYVATHHPFVKQIGISLQVWGEFCHKQVSRTLSIKMMGYTYPVLLVPFVVLVQIYHSAQKDYRLGSERLFALIKSLKNVHFLRETILLLVKDPERWKMRRSIHRMGLFPISIYNHISHHRSILDRVRKWHIEEKEHVLKEKKP